MLSQKAKYALQAVLILAEAWDNESLQIADIAERRRLPKRFLEQILLDLKHNGLVISRRGKNGGYGLIRPPSEITFAQVVRVIDGPIAPLPCLSKIAYRRCTDCADEGTCEIRHVFARVTLATREVLDTTTLADAVKSRTEDVLLA